MSLRAVVEIVIHLESFRNIDLFFQGIYYTCFRIYSKRRTGDGAATSRVNANGQAESAAQSQA